jgi:hypothetical protein
MHKDLSTYFLSIFKSSAPKETKTIVKQSTMRQGKYRKAASQKDWFFADMIVVNNDTLDMTEYNSKALLSKLVQTQEKEKKRQANPLVKLADTGEGEEASGRPPCEAH